MNTKVCYYIYLDDERMRAYPERILDLPGYVEMASKYEIVIPFIARTCERAIEDIEFAKAMGADAFVDFDHDLGTALSGYDCCKTIIENEFPLIGFTIHSMNSVGRQNMSQLMTHYGYKEYKYV